MHEKSPRILLRARGLLPALAWLLVLSIVVLATRSPHASGPLPGDADHDVPVSQEMSVPHSHAEMAGDMNPDCADTACSICFGIAVNESGTVPLAGMVPSLSGPVHLLSVSGGRLYRPPIRSS